MRNDKSLACYVIITRKESWENIFVPFKRDQSSRKQLSILETNDPSEIKSGSFARKADFCPATLAECVT
jgi:hypothetical protein